MSTPRQPGERDDDLRDPRVDAAWRDERDAPEPPRALDDAIRAAAHRAVRAQPQTAAAARKARSAWPAWMPLAAAACIGLIAIGIVELRPQDRDETHVTTSDVQAGGPATNAAEPTTKTAEHATAPVPANAPTPTTPTQPAPPPPAVTQPEPPRSAKVEAGPQPAMQAPLRKDAPPPPPQPAPRPDVAPMQLQAHPSAPAADSVDVQRERRAPASAPAPAPPPAGSFAPRAETAARAPSAFPADAGNASAPRDAVGSAARGTSGTLQAAPAAAPKPFDDYVADIRRALADKRDDDAIAALNALRRAYPGADERLPVDLRDWAFRVRP